MQEYLSELDTMDSYITDNELVQSEYPNPFYLSANASSFKFIRTKFIKDEYKCINILCLQNDFEPSDTNINALKLFFDMNAGLSELFKLKELVCIVQAPISIAKLQSIRMGLIVVNNTHIDPFNHEKYNLNSKELVFLMLETKKSNVNEWIKIYDNCDNIDDFIKMKLLTSYYKLNDETIDDTLLNLMRKTDEFKYWQHEKNCIVNKNNYFKNRKFNLKKFKFLDNVADEIVVRDFIDNMIKSNNEFKSFSSVEKTFYPRKSNSNTSDLNRKLRKYKSFFSPTNVNELKISKADVEELLTTQCLTEKEKYYLISNLLLSKNYCHYVINNKNVLCYNKQLFEKYNAIFRYLLGYTWNIFSFEEKILRTRVGENDRYVFDLETACQLPVFPFGYTVPYLNPYFTVTVSDKLIQHKDCIYGVNHVHEYQNGIVNINEFRRRLNIFMTGDENIDIFQNVDWSNIVITGGAMSGILPKTNPLMALFGNIYNKKDDIPNETLNSFFQEYYSSSDLDIACKHSNILDYINTVINLKKLIKNNIITQLNVKINESDIKTISNKTLSIHINMHLLKEICDKGELPYTFEHIMDNKNEKTVKLYFYNLYLDEKKKYNIKNKTIIEPHIKEDEYFELVNYCEFDKTTILINDYSMEISSTKSDFDRDVDPVFYYKTEKDKILIRFVETLKFKITIPYLKHPIEMFRILEPEFFSCIARFHLPCVRSYYNGTTCYLLPSAITAYHTLTNIDYKYFSGSVDPINIINKYRKRGYTTIMNELETKQFLYFIMNSEMHKKSYGVESDTSVNPIIGALDINHKFFKPRITFPELYVNINDSPTYNQVNLTYVDKSSLICSYQDKLKSYLDILTERTINSDGNINPAKRWIIDAGFDILNH